MSFKYMFIVVAILGLNSQHIAFGGSNIYMGTLTNSSGFSVLSQWGIENAINQSGLSDNYVSGVTDYDAFAALNPTHFGSSTLAYTGAFDEAPAFFDLDFGTSLTFTDFGLWNDNDYQGVKNFNIIISEYSDFSSSTTPGGFVATYGPWDYTQSIALQQYDLGGVSGRYVRVELLDAWGDNYINIGEVIFGATSAAVPEPASLAMWGLGAIGLVFAGRKRRQKMMAV